MIQSSKATLTEEQKQSKENEEEEAQKATDGVDREKLCAALFPSSN